MEHALQVNHRDWGLSLRDKLGGLAIILCDGEGTQALGTENR
jgi:hypothetical protein